MVLVLFAIACVFAGRFGYMAAKGSHHYTSDVITKIIAHKTDMRGLTSIIYVYGNDTLALDYLTPLQLDSVINK